MPPARVCIALVCCLCAVHARLPQFAERDVKNGSRIVNGVPVPHKNYPFMVSIEYHDAFNDGWYSTCGGSIINKVTVLTACHCATSDEQIRGFHKNIANPSTRRIVAGSAFWDEGNPSDTRQIANVRRIVTHPKCQNFPYMDRAFINDVSLYFLADPLTYNAEVQPIRIPSLDVSKAVQFLDNLIQERAWCTTIGWGRTVGTEPDQSQQLMGAKVRILDPAECRNRFCSMSFDHCRTDFEGYGQVCVASPTASACFGDSGGPLLCKGYVVGTVSYGDPPCPANLPTVFQGLRPILEILNYFNVQSEYESNEADGDEVLPLEAFDPINNTVPALNTTVAEAVVTRAVEPFILAELKKITALVTTLVASVRDGT